VRRTFLIPSLRGRAIRDDWLDIREVGPYVVATLHPDEVYPIVRASIPLKSDSNVKMDLVSVGDKLKPKRFLFPKGRGVSADTIWKMHDDLLKGWDECKLCDEYKKKLAYTPTLGGNILSAAARGAARGAVTGAVASFSGKVASAALDRVLSPHNRDSLKAEEKVSSGVHPEEEIPPEKSARDEAVRSFVKSLGIDMTKG